MLFLQLAMVHMSDHYTRITTGGSPLPRDSPVVGLLFGTSQQEQQQDQDEGLSWKILDADDIPPDGSDGMNQQISLHQAVFPQNQVVGWYRVTSVDAEPTATDLATTQRLANNAKQPILFCFYQIQQQKGEGEEFPIALFRFQQGVLVGMEGWKLETREAEKIAVEKVVREQPQAKSSKGDAKGSSSASPHVVQISGMQQAMEKLRERIVLLTQFLESCSNHLAEEDYPHALMRRVQTVVCQLGPILNATHSEPFGNDSVLLSHMAVTAKTLQIVQAYSEKFRTLQEHRVSSRDPRRY